MASRINVLVVGLGSIGQRHARLLAERQDVEIMLCDTSHQRLAEATQKMSSPPMATVSDYEGALAAQPEVVIVCTPDSTHVPISIAALECGLDVLLEKPISDDVIAARKLVATAKACRRFLQVGYMLRWDAGLQKIKSMVGSGEVGEVVGGRCMVGTYVTVLNARDDYRERRENALVFDYTHEFDFINWIYGPIAQVAATSAHLGRLEHRPRPNVVQVILETASGPIVQVHMDYVQFPQRRLVEVFGDRGTLAYDLMTGEFRHYHFNREHCWENHDLPRIQQRVDDMYRMEHESFFANRAAGRPPFVTGTDGLAALAVAEAVLAAAAERRFVPVVP